MYCIDFCVYTNMTNFWKCIADPSCHIQYVSDSQALQQFQILCNILRCDEEMCNRFANLQVRVEVRAESKLSKTCIMSCSHPISILLFYNLYNT